MKYIVEFIGELIWPIAFVFVVSSILNAWVFVRQSETMFQYGDGDCKMVQSKYITCSNEEKTIH